MDFNYFSFAYRISYNSGRKFAENSGQIRMYKGKLKPRKSLSWFERNVGKNIIQHHTDLFNPPVRVEDKKHAKALHAHQDKGFRYKK